jgi:hypothetical protein
LRIEVEEHNGYYKYKASQKGWFKPWIWGFGDTPEEAFESFKEKYRKYNPKVTKVEFVWNPKEDN